MAKRTAALKRFQGSTAKRIARNLSVEIASLPERAVPILGVAALIGTAAYEIRSDCELMTELNLLAQEHDVAPANTSTVCGFVVPTKEEVWSGVKAKASSFGHGIYESLAGLF